MSDFLPPAVIRLVTDIAGYAAGLKEATAQLEAFAAQGAAAVDAMNADMVASTEAAATAQTATWETEWTRQGMLAEQAALRTQVAQQRALTAGTAEYRAAMAAQVTAAEEAAAAESAAQDAALTGMQEKMAGFGKISAVAFIGAAAESVHLASSFEAAMEQIHTQAGVAQSQIKGLSDGVLALAGKVGVDPDSLAESLYHVESSFSSTGITGSKALQLVQVAAEGARVGGANLVDVTNALSASVASGIPGVKDFQQAMGVLNSTVGAGDMKMQDLASALGGGALAAVKTYGLSINDVGAALAVFGDNNIRGAAAGTQLRMTVQSLAKPAATAGDMLKRLGLSTTSLATDMQHGGLNAALTDLKTRMTDAGVTAAQQGQVITDLFGKKAGTGINVLVDQYGRLQSKYEEVAKGQNGFAASWAGTQSTFKQQADQLKSQAQALGVKFGEWLLPKLEGVAKFFADHQNIAKGMIASLAGLMALSVGMWIAGIVGGIVDATAAMIGFDAATDANPIGAFVLLAEIAIAALIAIIYELIKHWKGVKTVFIDAWHGIETAWNATWDALKTAWHAVVDALKTAWDKVSGAFVDAWNWVVGGLKTVWGGITRAWHDVGSALKTAWHDTLGALKDAVHPFVTGFKDTVSGIKRAWRDVTSGLSKAWHDVWGDVKRIASDTWHVLEPIFKGIAKAINIILIPIRLQVLAFEIAYKAISAAVKWFWHSVLEPFGKAVWSILEKTVGGAIHGLEAAWKTVWNALGKAVDWVWNSVLQPTFHFIAKAFDTVIGTALHGLEKAWHTVWNALSTAVSAVWNDFLSPTFHAIASAFDAVIGFALRALEATWHAIWGGIKTAISDVWHGFLEPTFHSIANAFDAVIGFALRTLEATWKSVWGNIKAALAWVWDSFISPTFHSIGDAFDKVIGAAGRGFQDAWSKIWGGIKGTVDWVWGAIKTTFDSISRAIHDITGGISTVAGKVGGFVGTLNKVLPFAEGGSPPVGRAVLVGERGPELAVFGAPAYIHPAGETKSMLSGGKAYGGWVGSPSSFGGAGGPNVTVVVEVPVNLDGQVLFKSTQKQALRYNRRNPTNGMARVAGL